MANKIKDKRKINIVKIIVALINNCMKYTKISV